jgi:hypothetical protein
VDNNYLDLGIDESEFVTLDRLILDTRELEAGANGSVQRLRGISSSTASSKLAGSTWFEGEKKIKCGTVYNKLLRDKNKSIRSNCRLLSKHSPP